MIPGEAHAKVIVCDEDGDELETYAFSTGWRLDCDKASVVPYPGREDTDLLLIECSEATFETGPALEEYFGITADDRLAIVRLAAPGGTFAGFPGYSSGHPLGTAPPRRTPIEWRDVLIGGDPVAVLEALNWLGGHHLDAAFSLERSSNVLMEPAESARDVTAAIESEDIRAAVRTLASSPDPWIAEAAAAALENFDEIFKSRRERQWRDARDAERRSADAAGALGSPPSLRDPELRRLIAGEGWIARTMRGRTEAAATHYGRALLKYRSNDHRGAIACLDSALALDPDWDAAYSLRATNREALGDWDGAISDEEKAAALNPDEQNLLGVALSYRRRGDEQSALRFLDRTIEVSPNCLQARWHRAEVREQLGDLEGAIAEFTWIADTGVYNEDDARKRIAALELRRASVPR
jgi:tetratricopeptide (TPR) repeat protein